MRGTAPIPKGFKSWEEHDIAVSKLDRRTEGVVSIEVTFDDGASRVAVGEIAQKIWTWWMACEPESVIHKAWSARRKG